jgi:thioredoxin 1
VPGAASFEDEVEGRVRAKRDECVVRTTIHLIENLLTSWRIMSIDTVIHTNQHSIDRVLKTGLPIMLVFWSSQNRLTPLLDSLLDEAARQHAGKLLIAKIDAATEPALQQRFNIRQLPALIALKPGADEGRLSGQIQPDDVRAWLIYLLGSGARPALRSAAVPTNGAASTGVPVTLTDRNFEAMINRPEPVLVDFWAPWCGPCRMVAPSIDHLASEFSGRAVVGKLNVDENPRTAQRYGVQGIPALLIFQQGRVVDQLVGAQPLPVLQQHLRRFVK